MTVLGARRIRRIRAENKVQNAARAAIATLAVGYVRVSTEDQADRGHGLDAQDKAIRAFAESQGYDLVDVIADPGVSGSTKPIERPGFARIAELAAAGAFSVLLVHKFDRLARSIVYAITTVNDLGERHGVMLRSVTESIETTSPAGKMMFAVFAAMAENERYAIRDRTKGGRVQKASKGGYAGGRAPYGYERDREGGLCIVDAQASIVREIIRARRRRPKRTLQSIADDLNGRGVPAPDGGRWHPTTVSNIAGNPKYHGWVEYLFRSGSAETHVLREGAHPAIV